MSLMQHYDKVITRMHADIHQVDSIIEKAKRKLPEFLGMRFGNHYIGGAK